MVLVETIVPITTLYAENHRLSISSSFLTLVFLLFSLLTLLIVLK